MVGFEEDGNPRTFNLLKPLICDKPLMEFRVNRSRPGAFRGKTTVGFHKVIIEEGHKQSTGIKGCDSRKRTALYRVSKKSTKIYNQR